MNSVISLLFIAIYWPTRAETETGPMPKCESVYLPMCLQDATMPYNVTGYPNLFNHKNQNDAGLQAHQYFPLIKTDCSPYLRLFICSVFAPSCKSQGEDTFLQYPCRKLCEKSQAGCDSFMSKFGYHWPDSLDCQKFPENGYPCIDDIKNVPPTLVTAPVVEQEKEEKEDPEEPVKKVVVTEDDLKTAEIMELVEKQKNNNTTVSSGGTLCVPGAYPCPDGRCIPYTWLCDGHFDCSVIPSVEDELHIASDENALVCALRKCDKETEFTCSLDSRPKCIPIAKKCDGKAQCNDGSDEQGCGSPKLAPDCASTHFQCTSKVHLCVPPAWVCDGTPDCPDGSDEGGHCISADRCDSEIEFMCSTGKCINKEWKCDGEMDCKHGDDEAGCNPERRDPVQSDKHPIHDLLRLRFPFKE